MKNVLLLGVLTAVAACGGAKNAPPDALLDATVACNPVAQTGCMAGEKCTWIVDLDATATMSQIGHTGCAPNGATAGGAECTDALAFDNGGTDDCVAGQLCVSGTCKPICDPQLVGNAGTGACAANYTCSTYAAVFESAGNAVAGVCEPTCDPLTQALNVGNTGTAACGSPDPAQPSATCIVSTGFRSFHCAPSSDMFYDKLDRDPPLTDSLGKAYDNGCAPGFIPFYFEDGSGTMKTLCTGLCAPLKVDQTIASQAAHKDDNRGDPKALGKLPTDAAPAVGNAVCEPGIKGSEVTAPHGQDCRYLWFPLAKGDPTKPLQSPFNDTLGVCFAYEKFLTVTVPGMPQKQPEKSCADLPAAPTDDPYGSAKDNGCYPLTESVGFGSSRVRAPSYRLGNGDGAVLRHVFD